MAGEVKYGNTLISSRKDGILSYAKYIRDLKSGKNVEEVLEELRQTIRTVDIDKLDTLCKYTDGLSGQPVVYAVIQANRNAGILFLFSDSMSHVVTQIITTHCLWNNGNFNAHDDAKIHCYSRSYNINAAHATWDKGTWSEWTPFIDYELNSKVNLMWNALTNITSVKALEDSDIDDIWNTIFNKD